MDLLLIRHGQSESNRETRFSGQGDSPLTDIGRKQASALAAALAAEGEVTRIYSSDLVRATETAGAIARTTGAQVLVMQALRERSVGEFTGLTYAEAAEKDPVAFERMLTQRDPHARPPGGEDANDVVGRVAPLLADVRGNAEGRVLIVAHAFTLNVMLRVLLETPSTGPGIGFYTDPCAVHRLQIEGGRVFVRALNDVRHLARQ